MNDKILKIVICFATVGMFIIAFLLGDALGDDIIYGNNKTELTIEDINDIKKPIGYTCQTFNNGELIDEHVYYYQDDLKRQLGLIPHHFNIVKWSSGPEDGMIYTLCDTNIDGSNYVLFITDPSKDNKFVSCGVQEGNTYYLY